MPKTHRLRAPSYPLGVMPAVEVSEEPSEKLAPPPAKAPRAKWVEYAGALGVDVAGLSKAQIRKAVS